MVAGLIFALHPIHPEAVSWISGRFDVLCGALISWSFAAFLMSRDSRRDRRFLPLVASYILFALACFTKEMAFAYPFVVLAFVLILPHTDDTPGRRKWELWAVAGFFGLAVLLFILRASVIGGIGGYTGYEGSSVAEMLYFLFIQPFYWFFLPLNRSLFSDIGPPTLWVVGIIILAPLAMLAFKPPWRVIAFSAAAIVLSTLPVAQIGYIDPQMQSSRFLYIPSLFFAILAAALLTGTAISSRKTGRYSGLPAGVYLLTMLLILNQNNFAWQEAGRVTRSAADSAVQLAETHRGEWGLDYKKLVVYNVPDAYLGAYVFREGFLTMLRHRTGGLLDEVEIQMIIEEIDRFENVGELKLVFDVETAVWFFNDIDSVFEEVTEEEKIPPGHSGDTV